MKRFFQFHDWIWSIALGFLAYWLLNWGPPSIGGVVMTYYAVNFVQPLLATGAVMAGLMFITRLGLYFYFKGVHKYIWGGKYGHFDRTFKNYSKQDFYERLIPWQRFLFAFFVAAGLFVAALIVFLKFLSLAGSGPM